MRDLNEELNKIIDFAKRDENIRALVLQGSFVNDNVVKDEYSDLDPLFYVRDLNEFIEKEEWKNTFGQPISGFADEGDFHDGHKWYTKLTIYEDGFKIDFGFQSVDLAKYAKEMPLYKIYLDKDGIIPKPEVDDERRFYVKKPTEEEYLERINTFFYDSSYMAKSLARNEIFFAKYIESVLQKKIRILLEWCIGIQYNFHVNTGLMGRYFRRYLDDEVWNMLMKTYADGDRINLAKALMNSFDLVKYLGKFISKSLGYDYPSKHERDMRDYCSKILNKMIKDIS